MLQTRARRSALLTPVAVLCGLLAATAVCADQKTQNPILANVVDTKGTSYSVTALEAKYTEGGMWIGGPPPTTWTASLHLKLWMAEGRITTTEQREFRFASIRRVAFDKAQSGAVVRIELLDGSQIVLTPSTFETLEVGGGKRVVQIQKWQFATEGDRSIDGFRGRSRTQSGKEGEFWIPIYETQSIEFR